MGLSCKPNIYVSWSTSELRVRLAPSNRFKPSSIIFYWPFQGGTFLWIFYVFVVSCVCYVFVRVCLYMLCGHLMGKGWPLGSRLWCLLWVCHFPIGILGQVWYLIVSIPDLCTLTFFAYIAYEVRISCMGRPATFKPLCMCIVTSKTNFIFFQSAPVVVYRLVTSVFSTSHHRCYWLSRCLCKHFTIWRMNQNIAKNIIGNVASSYQVNLAIEIPNITKNYINMHVFTCRHWVSAMLI